MHKRIIQGFFLNQCSSLSIYGSIEKSPFEPQRAQLSALCVLCGKIDLFAVKSSVVKTYANLFDRSNG